MNEPVNAVRVGVAVFALAGAIAASISCGGGGGGGAAAVTGTTGTTGGGGTPSITTKAQLGQALFNETALSNPPGESCGTCHNASRAFTDPRPGPTSQGAVAGLFNFRHAPSIKYMAYSPEFSLGNGEAGGAIGGQFWDGHAADLTAQATFPMLNPVEMNNPSQAAVVANLQKGSLAAPFMAIYGQNVFSNAGTAFADMVDAIVTFENTPAVSPFSSKYDAFLSGQAQLTPQELNGLSLFNGKGGCSGCHVDSPLPDGTPAMFTGFCYANLGLPKNPNNPYYTMPAKINPLGAAFVDLGLERTTGRAEDAGFFMTTSLRNVAVTGPYFHNGFFTTLAQVVHFYNTRDLGGFPPPEVPQTEDKTELGNLGLTAQEEADIVTFLGTLTDGYTASSQVVKASRFQKSRP